MHLKRQKAPKKWPITRKGTSFVVRPLSNLNGGIPLLIVMRDMLKIAQNRREVKRAIHEKNILVNLKPVKDERHSLLLFDLLTIVPENKNYRIEMTERGKFSVMEDKNSETKVAKVKNKKMLKGKRIQLNLSDGNNFFSDIKCDVNDSVLIDLKENKIQKCLPLKEKANVFVFEGKHAGKRGIVNKIMNEKRIVELSKDKDIFNVLIKQLIITE
jgi:small subunit ribosomal protein S4e